MKPLPLPLRVAAGLVATAVEQARELPRLVVEFPVTAVSQALQASMRVQQKVTDLAIKGDRALGALRPVEDRPSWATFDDEVDAPRHDPPRHNGTVTTLRPPVQRTGAAATVAATEEPLPPAGAAAADELPATLPEPRTGPAGPGTDAAPADEDLADAGAEGDGVGDTGADAVGAAPDDSGARLVHRTETGTDDDAAPMPEPGSATPADLAALPADAAPDTPAPAADDGPGALPGYPDMTIPQLRGRLRHLTLDDLRALLDWEQAHGDRPPFVTMLSNRITTVLES